MSVSAKCNVCISYCLWFPGILVNVFICPSLDHTQCSTITGTGSFKVLLFFNSIFWCLYYYYYLLIDSFFTPVLADGFHWSLSDSKFPQISRTLPSILAVLNNAVVWMVPTRPPTSKSSCSFKDTLVTVPKVPITIGIIVTFMFHSFFDSLARVEILILLFTFFHFIQWSASTAKSTILQILFFVVVVVDYY